ncbi:MAG: DUF1189 family protein [Acholeplasma sp.]|nr:DUF1189 family protein [Acholeplasma sp.]
MYMRFKDTLTNPKLAFKYIKDKKSTVFLYVLLMVFLLTLPTIIMAFINPKALVPSNLTVASEVKTNFSEKGLKIQDYQLVNETGSNYSFTIEDFTYVVGDIPDILSGYAVVLEQKEVKLYMVTSMIVMLEINNVSYEELGINDLIIDSNSYKEFANKVNEVVNNNFFISVIVFETFIYMMIDFLFTALLLTVLASFFYQIRISFSEHFKINVYIMTGWAVVNLLLILFGLTELTTFSILVAYIFQSRAYHGVTVVTRVRRDEDEKK